MKRRYVTLWAPVGEWTEEPHGGASIDVIEAENAPRPTGLLDKDGREMFALEERPAVGFLRFDESA